MLLKTQAHFYQVSLILQTWLLYNMGHCPVQCDQVARSFVQYLAIFKNENNLPNSIKNIPKLWNDFAKY